MTNSDRDVEFTGAVDSPFLEEELLVGGDEEDWEPRAAALRPALVATRAIVEVSLEHLNAHRGSQLMVPTRASVHETVRAVVAGMDGLGAQFRWERAD